MQIQVVDNSYLIDIFGLDNQESLEFSFEKLSFLGQITKLTAPELIVMEFGNVLLQKSKKSLSLSSNIEFWWQAFWGLDLQISYFDEDDYSEIFLLAKKYNLSFYDASYLYLAQLKKAPLLTLDQKLQKAYEKISK